MCPVHGCPEKCQESLSTPTAAFPEIFNGMLRMCVQNVKFVALAVSEIIWGTQKIWEVPGYAHAPFFQKF